MIRQYTDRGISSLSLDDRMWLLRALTLRFSDNIGLVSLAICRIKSMQRNRILKSSEYMIIEQIIGYLYMTVAGASMIGSKFTSTTKPPPGIVMLVGKLKSMPLRMRQVFAGFTGS